METSLFALFKERRNEGRRCSPNWFKKTAMREMSLHYPLLVGSFCASNGWFVRFCHRFGLVLRKKTNKKKSSVAERSQKVEQFHSDLRRFLATNQGGRKDPKWGRVPRNSRYNKDQVPLPFVVSLNDTYEEQGAKEVWIRQNQAGMDKRFCTLELCFHPGQNQPRPGIVFRGKGKRISAVEKALWDPRVYVMFQEKAWVDRAINDLYTKEVICPFMHHEHPLEEEKVIFCDNLEAQTTQSFLNLLRTVNCSRYLQPPDSTDLIQAVDAGLGRLTKFQVGKQFDEWLEQDDHLHKWEDGKISSSEKRILITKWVGEAWEVIFKSGKYNPDKFFEHTGCLLTLDGSEDHLIKIQGLPYYNPPPPPPAVRVEVVEEFPTETFCADGPEPLIAEKDLDTLEDDEISVQSEEGEAFENEEFFENADVEYAQLFN